MSRRPLFGKAMTDAERQRRRRDRIQKVLHGKKIRAATQEANRKIKIEKLVEISQGNTELNNIGKTHYPVVYADPLEICGRLQPKKGTAQPLSNNVNREDYGVTCERYCDEGCGAVHVVPQRDVRSRPEGHQGMGISLR